MARLDPTRALSSPYLAQRFTVIRRPATVSTTGKVQIGPTERLDAIGVITFPSAARLQREDAYQIQGKAISIVTKTRLYGAMRDRAGQQYQPDVILWRGDHYQVVSVDDWTNFGAGFVNALAASTDYVDEAPRE
jgi:hypothetical protein